MANSEDPGEMPHKVAILSGSALSAKIKSIFGERIQYFGEFITCNPSIYTKDHPGLTVSNYMEYPIGLKRVNTVFCFLFQELYFKYTWNNFLHTHVAVCLYTILNNPPIDVEDKKQWPLLDQVSIGIDKQKISA